MENKTELKESRNGWFWLIWLTVTVVFGLSLEFVFEIEGDKPLTVTFLGTLGVQFLFVIYRVLIFCFNSFLAKIVKKRWKIDRLKDRVSPIYKFNERYYRVEKYTAQYTNLDLEWSVPFSILFLEQEYIKEGKEYYVENLDEVIDLETFWDANYAKDQLKYIKKVAEKTKKQQKIDNLNKTFNQNYK